MFYRSLAALLIAAVTLLGLGGTTIGGPLRVTATGDSITKGYAYSYSRLQTELDKVGVEATTSVVARGGLGLRHWLGESAFDGEVRDYSPLVLGTNPDVVAFMMGTNDSWLWINGGADAEFRRLYSDALDRLVGQHNAQDEAIRLVVLELLPIHIDADRFGNDNLVTRIRSAAIGRMNSIIHVEAAERGLPVIETNKLLQQQPGWQDWYSDGVHLWGDDPANAAGYEWLASTVAAHIVPEPISAALLLVGLLLIALSRHNH